MNKRIISLLSATTLVVGSSSALAGGKNKGRGKLGAQLGEHHPQRRLGESDSPSSEQGKGPEGWRFRLFSLGSSMDIFKPREPRKVLPTKRIRLADGPLEIDYHASYGGGEGGPPVVYETGSDSLQRETVVWLHGAGQNTDNELIRRMVNAAHKRGIALEVHSVPYEPIPGDTFEAQYPEIAAALAGKGKVVLGGHSAGGGKALRLANAHPDKFKALITMNGAGVNPYEPVAIPALYFMGENDGGRRFLATEQEEAEVAAKTIVAKPSSQRGTLAIVAQGDHSLRWRQLGDGDKARAGVSPQTEAMNAVVMDSFRKFLDSLPAGPSGGAK